MPDLEKDGENVQDNTSKQSDNPTDKMWSLYLAEAEKVDKALVESWTGDMDGILIFAGLFSASVTAFIIESYKKLSPDSGDTTVALLMQISSQLVAISNGTNLNAPPPPSTNIQFQPMSSMVAVNILWFLSLALALMCALSATLVQQWARNYLQLIERRPSPNKRARMRVFMYGGVERFKMTAVVDAIPTLLHISLFLFFVGVVIFLFPINLHVALTMVMVYTIGFILYAAVTVLPIRHKNCPYQTPLSPACWNVLQYFYLLRYNLWFKFWFSLVNLRDRLDCWKPSGGYPTQISLADARELLATEWSHKSVERNVAALHWTLESATDLSQLEQFLDAVPAFYRHSSGNADDLGLIGLWTSVSYRSESFLVQCQRDVQTPGRRRRLMACMRALQAMAPSLPPLKCTPFSRVRNVVDTIAALRNDSDTTIATRAMCMVASLTYSLVLQLAKQVPSRSNFFTDEVADEQLLMEISDQLPVDELAMMESGDGPMPIGSASKPSAEVTRGALCILQTNKVLDALERWIASAPVWESRLCALQIGQIYQYTPQNQGDEHTLAELVQTRVSHGGLSQSGRCRTYFPRHTPATLLSPHRRTDDSLST